MRKGGVGLWTRFSRLFMVVEQMQNGGFEGVNVL